MYGAQSTNLYWADPLRVGVRGKGGECLTGRGSSLKVWRDLQEALSSKTTKTTENDAATEQFTRYKFVMTDFKQSMWLKAGVCSFPNSDKTRSSVAHCC